MNSDGVLYDVERYKALAAAYDGSLARAADISDVLAGDHEFGARRGIARLLIIRAMQDAYLTGFKAGRKG